MPDGKFFVRLCLAGFPTFDTGYLLRACVRYSRLVWSFYVENLLDSSGSQLSLTNFLFFPVEPDTTSRRVNHVVREDPHQHALLGFLPYGSGWTNYGFWFCADLLPIASGDFLLPVPQLLLTMSNTNDFNDTSLHGDGDTKAWLCCSSDVRHCWFCDGAPRSFL